jgi:hypothetical protein
MWARGGKGLPGARCRGVLAGCSVGWGERRNRLMRIRVGCGTKPSSRIRGTLLNSRCKSRRGGGIASHRSCSTAGTCPGRRPRPNTRSPSPLDSSPRAPPWPSWMSRLMSATCVWSSVGLSAARSKHPVRTSSCCGASRVFSARPWMCISGMELGRKACGVASAGNYQIRSLGSKTCEEKSAGAENGVIICRACKSWGRGRPGVGTSAEFSERGDREVIWGIG